MKNLLKKLNLLIVTEGRTKDQDKIDVLEEKQEEISKEILKELGRDEGFSIDESEQAEKLFTDNGLTASYAWLIGDGGWS